MNDPRLIWALFAPLLAAAVAALFLQPLPARWRPERLRWWPAAAALVAACAGLLAQAALLLTSEGRAAIPALDITLDAPGLARLGLAAVDAALLCVLFLSWTPVRPGRAGSWPVPVVVSILTTAALLGLALMAADRLVSVLALLGAAIAVAVLAALPLPADWQTSDPDRQAALSKRLAGGLKEVTLAGVSTGLLVAGGLLLARYPFNLENTGGLQLGFGLLAVGLALRAGTMPFAGSAADLIEAAPLAAIVMLGAATPTALIVGVLILAPLEPGLAEVSRAGRQMALGLGAAGAVLAGLRALAVRAGRERERVSGFALLAGATVALQTAWALFGALSGSREGEAGAALLAANMALAVPLLLTARRGPLLALGVGSLIGLPPLGGFAGTLLVARAAVDHGGGWLAALLLGSLLVAGAWVGARAHLAEGEDEGPEGWPAHGAPVLLLSWALVAAQVVFFLLALRIVGEL